MIVSQKIEMLVLDTLSELISDFDLKMPDNLSGSTVLFGKGGLLDSMALVNLIADLEELVSKQFNATVILADEKAMSARNSPFLTVSSLVRAIEERIT